MDASASLCFARRAFESANHCFFSASAPASAGAVEHAFFDAGFDAETRVAETRVAETTRRGRARRGRARRRRARRGRARRRLAFGSSGRRRFFSDGSARVLRQLHEVVERLFVRAGNVRPLAARVALRELHDVVSVRVVELRGRGGVRSEPARARHHPVRVLVDLLFLQRLPPRGADDRERVVLLERGVVGSRHDANPSVRETGEGRGRAGRGDVRARGADARETRRASPRRRQRF